VEMGTPLENGWVDATPGYGPNGPIGALQDWMCRQTLFSPFPPGPSRFSCPPNFTAMPPASESPRLSLEALTGPDTELWLIQAPADFAPAW
jgi:hypothetical protein